jgi:hypothetical protein
MPPPASLHAGDLFAAATNDCGGCCSGCSSSIGASHGKTVDDLSFHPHVARQTRNVQINIFCHYCSLFAFCSPMSSSSTARPVPGSRYYRLSHRVPNGIFSLFNVVCQAAPTPFLSEPSLDVSPHRLWCIPEPYVLPLAVDLALSCCRTAARPKAPQA